MNEVRAYLKNHLTENARGRLTFLLLPMACAAIAHATGSLAGGAFVGAALACLAFAVAGGACSWTMLDDAAACAVEKVYEYALPVGLAIGVAGFLLRDEPLLYATGGVALAGLGFLAGIVPVTTPIVEEPETHPAAVTALRGSAALQLILTLGLIAFAPPLVAAGVGVTLLSVSAYLYARRDDVVTMPVAMR